MIRSLEIKNFRCFSTLKLDELPRVNVIVGENGSGKTALLEALYLAMGAGPELALRIRGWRGLPDRLKPGVTDKSFRAFWADLFHRLDSAHPISISIADSQGTRRDLSISYLKEETYVVPFSNERSHASPSIASSLSFNFKIGDKEQQVLHVELTEQGLKMGRIADIVPEVFVNTGGQYGPNTVLRFSELSKEGKEELVTDAVRSTYPRVQALSIEVQDSTPMLFASVDDVPGKIPVEFVSSGLTKYITLLCAILDNAGGVVLIDEIENGFHYSKLPALWTQLHKFCAEHDVQLFASTHSLECLRALSGAVTADPDDFALLRMTAANGQATVEKFGGDMIEAALEQRVEIR